MRGPGLRIKYDVRRLWHCPACGYERHVPATETAVRCHCRADKPWMKLVESQRTVRPPSTPVNPYVELDPDEPESEIDASVAGAPVGNKDLAQSSGEVTTGTVHNISECSTGSARDIVSQEIGATIESAADVSPSEKVPGSVPLVASPGNQSTLPEVAETITPGNDAGNDSPSAVRSE